MNPTERVKKIRKEIGKIEDSCRSDEVAEACEFLRDGCDALETAIADELGPQDRDLEDEGE